MDYMMFARVSSSLIVGVKRLYQMSDLLISRCFCKWRNINKIELFLKGYSKT